MTMCPNVPIVVQIICQVYFSEQELVKPDRDKYKKNNFTLVLKWTKIYYDENI